MSKVDDFLLACKNNVGEWVCSLHTTGSNQPAAIFREAKKQGYDFEEIATNRWAKSQYCEICKQQTTHYKLLSCTPVLSRQVRLTIDGNTRNRILSLFNYQDAFTGASISSTPEIDHKIPWTRLDHDIDARNLSNDAIKQHFQLLTREHNLLKDRACGYCKKFNKRPPLFGVQYWYEGNEDYCGSCNGCGWYDGTKWRDSLNNKLYE